MKVFLFANPNVLEMADKVFFVIFAVMFVAAVFFRILQENKKNHMVLAKLFHRIFVITLTISLLGGIWAGMRYLAVPYLGTRFVAVLLSVCFLVWFFFVVKYLVMRFGNEMKYWQEQQVKAKYLK